MKKEEYDHIINVLENPMPGKCRFEAYYHYMLDYLCLEHRGADSIPEKNELLITIDGIGGSGKDSVIDNITGRIDLVNFREDECDPFIDYMKRYWKKEDYDPLVIAFLSTFGKRYVNETVLADLLDCCPVITNRSYLSTIAYSMVEGLEPDELLQAYNRFPYMPDLRIILQCDPEVAYERKKKERIGRSDSPEYLQKSYHTFASVAKLFPGVVVIDTTDIDIQQASDGVYRAIQRVEAHRVDI